MPMDTVTWCRPFKGPADDGLANPLGTAQGTAQRGERQDDDEFLAADPAHGTAFRQAIAVDAVHGAQRTAHAACKGGEDAVAGDMAEAFVHVPEVIDVEQAHAERIAGALGARLFAREQVEYRAPAPGVGELVAFGAPFDALEFLLQFLHCWRSSLCLSHAVAGCRAQRRASPKPTAVVYMPAASSGVPLAK